MPFSNEGDRVGHGEIKTSRMGMSEDDFRNAANEMSEYIISYYKSLNGRQAIPSVTPGFLTDLLPKDPPNRPENWEKLFVDLEKVVMRGMSHWQSSNFFAYFPTGTSYPSILADMLSNAVSSVDLSWASSPISTEMEATVLGWLGQAIGLPDCFIHSKVGPGYGVIQGLMGMVQLHKLPVDENISVTKQILEEAIKIDMENGKIPFYVCATLGTTSCVSFDDLSGIGEVCAEEDIWLHVDAAYAGCSFVCQEFRHHMKGIEMASSFNCSPHKWLMVNTDCSVLWVKNNKDLLEAFKMQPEYARHPEDDVTIDHRHMRVAFGCRFRSLKLWFVFRLIGVDGLKQKIRDDVKMAKLFETYVKKDKRFEVVFPVHLSLVCIRLKVSEDPKVNKSINVELLKRINQAKEIYLVPSEVEDVCFLRISVGTVACDENAIKNCWNVIQKHADLIFRNSLENGSM
uniref:aromatic-L-amino-acid decarboxylase-like isoform X2 n=1 Tax=Styela clava TaxID=7725 RepID=UPI001939950B|nr:aromatic-L-amino-acid decarboxylase-like isoform X2 [Styela clava]